MNTTENENGNSFRASQEPHQREEMDQAEAASSASFTLEPEKGITPEPGKFNRGDAQDNIKQIEGSDEENPTEPGGAITFDPVSDVDLDEDENTVTRDDLQALNGMDRDEES